MWKVLIFLAFYNTIAFGEDWPNWPSKHKKLFESIKLPDLPGIRPYESDVEKLRIALSLEVLSKINRSTAPEVQCIVNNLTEGNTSVYHLDIISEMLERYDYHDSGYLPCKATREVLTNEELKNISEKIWKNKLLRNEIPSAYCRGRAFLTSKILDDMGMKSKMLIMKGDIIATYKTHAGFKVDAYNEHYVNVVNVEESGVNTEYVIDPMFTDGPIELSKYLKLTSFPGMPLQHETKHQTYADKLSPPLNDEICRYNVKLLKDYEDAIKESLDRPSQESKGRTFESSQEAKEAYVQEILKFNASMN
jgi:hypothetical protein